MFFIHVKLGFLELIISTDDLLENLKSLDSNRVRWIRFNEVLKAGEEKGIIPIIESPKDHVYTLYYTSGTTGEPKAAMLTHENWVVSLMKNETTESKKNGSQTFLNLGSFGHLAERLLFSGSTQNGWRYALNSHSKAGNIHYNDRMED